MTKETTKKNKKKLRPIRLMFCLIIFCIVVIIIKFLLIQTAKPNVAVNYLEKINQLTKPKNYDPAQNAAPLYFEASDLMVKKPENLPDPKINSLSNMTSQQLSDIKSWLDSNAATYDLFQKGVKKPYYWVERKAPNGKMLDFDQSDLIFAKNMLDFAQWKMKVLASEGNYKEVVELLVDLQSFSQHISMPSTFVDQVVGLSISCLSCSTVLEILNDYSVNSETLSYLSQQLTTQLEKTTWGISYTKAEYQIMLDFIKRMFSEDKDGNGKLIPSAMVRDFKGGVWELGYSDAINIAASHQDRKSTLKLAEKLYEDFQLLSNIPPLQLYMQGTTYDDKAQEYASSSVLFAAMSRSIGTVIALGHRHKPTAEALLAVAAVLHYRNDKGVYPDSLKKLVKAGYLETLPIDPYSEKTLVYRKTDSGFTLYSIGLDFNDDGGKHDRSWGQKDGDYVFWPIQKIEKGKHQ